MPKHDPRFPASFLLLQQEGYLISACLSAGLTQLRAAHVHNKGAFYTSLFNLSIGVERLLKSIIIIDHMLDNGLAVPTRRQLKDYGHNIAELYDVCVGVAARRSSPLIQLSQLDAINQDLLLLLSDFAQTTRYHNLDALATRQPGNDPLARWNEVLLAVLKRDVPAKTKERALARSRQVADAIDDITVTMMHGLDKKPLSTFDALSLPIIHDQAARQVVWRIVSFLSPIRDLLAQVSRLAYDLKDDVPPFPQMHEFLQWLPDDRAYVLARKKWP